MEIKSRKRGFGTRLHETLAHQHAMMHMRRATAFIFFCLVFIACNASVDTNREDTTREDTTPKDTTREKKSKQRSSSTLSAIICWFEQLLPLNTLTLGLMSTSWYTFVTPATDCNLSSSIWKLQWEIIITDHITVHFQPVSQPASKPASQPASQPGTHSLTHSLLTLQYSRTHVSNQEINQSVNLSLSDSLADSNQ